MDNPVDTAADRPADTGTPTDTGTVPDGAGDGGACPAGRTRCGAECADLTSDANHCGRCMNACPAGQRCAAGTCGMAETTWSTNATDRDCEAPGVLGMRFMYNCPPAGTPGSVWGTGVYTHDSSVCGAAAHAGRITTATGGMVTIEYRAGQPAYTGSMRNGVTSNDYGTWRCSFAVVAPACAGGAMDCTGLCAAVMTDPLHCGRCGNACGAGGTCAAGACACAMGTTRCGAACVDTRTDAMNCGGCGRACTGGMGCTGGTCGAPPATWSTNALDHDCAMPGVVGSTFTYRCPAGGTAGSVWGTDVYTNDSSVCTAGVHFGRITLATGGMVTIQMAPGQAMYMGSMRNGVTSSDYGMWGCSYLFR